jgi:hypothetical protein
MTYLDIKMPRATGRLRWSRMDFAPAGVIRPVAARDRQASPFLKPAKDPSVAVKPGERRFGPTCSKGSLVEEPVADRGVISGCRRGGRG